MRLYMQKQQMIDTVNRFIIGKKYDDIKSFLLSAKESVEKNNDLATVCYLCTIYDKEKAAGQSTIFSKVSDVEELLERYTKLKFYLRRIDFDVMDSLDEFYQFLSQQQISSYELLTVIDFSVVNKEKVLKTIKQGNVTGKEVGDIKRNMVPEEQMPEKGICFILCTNDRFYAEECIYYINHLNVPEGYWIDVLTVEEAESMTAGYNEAMEYSQAKYKVYLHQDTFLINPDFLQDILYIFEHNPQIGMIGNVGVRKMPESGVMWDADRFGMLYEQHIYETQLLLNGIDTITEEKYLEVDAIDGFIMITQYDVKWRSDLFNKWDFYDCSQSMEFIRQGYKVAVPKMCRPWCVHDCGFINLSNYDVERQKFVLEYLSTHGNE